MLLVLCSESCQNHNNKSDFDYTIIPVQTDSKWAFIDRTGKYTINPQFSEAYYFTNDLARVELDEGKVGYINKEGLYAINPQFSKGTIFSNDLAYVVGGNSYPICITKNGDTAFLLNKIEGVSAFSEGISTINTGKRYGAINTVGDSIIPPQFEYLGVFHQGLAVYGSKSKADTNELSYGYVDKSGTIIIKAQYNDVGSFSDGLAAVKTGEKWGFIDKEGKLKITPQFEQVGEFAQGMCAFKQGKQWGYINLDGAIKINPQFESAKSFSNGYAAVEVTEDNWGYIDKKGVLKINPQFEAAGYFNEKLAPVKVGNKIGFINPKGEYVINPQFTSEASYASYIGQFLSGPFYTYCTSTYYDPSSASEKLASLIDPKWFIGVAPGSSITELLDDSLFSDMKELSDYSTVCRPYLKLNDEISLNKIEFLFDEKVYSMVPEYYYGFRVGEKKKYKLNISPSSVKYTISIQDYGKSSDKGEYVLAALKDMIMEEADLSERDQSNGDILLQSDIMKVVLSEEDNEIEITLSHPDETKT